MPERLVIVNTTPLYKNRLLNTCQLAGGMKTAFAEGEKRDPLPLDGGGKGGGDQRMLFSTHPPLHPLPSREGIFKMPPPQLAGG